MTIAKFLLIDSSFIILTLLVIFILQKNKSNPIVSRNLNTNQILTNKSILTPNLKELLTLEKLSKKEGSGIEFNSLIGLWMFMSVWKQGTDEEDALSSSLLRLFSASLELKNRQSNETRHEFEIINSIKFGILSIRFIGLGELKGSQPLLPFYFESIELKLGKKLLLNRSLDIPDIKNRPFFGLISMEANGNWLSARGRGGGLALWLKDQSNL